MKNVVLIALSSLALLALPVQAKEVQLSPAGCVEVAQIVGKYKDTKTVEKSTDKSVNQVAGYIIKNFDRMIPDYLSSEEVTLALAETCYAAQGRAEVPEEI
mgnify:FL=1